MPDFGIRLRNPILLASHNVLPDVTFRLRGFTPLRPGHTCLLIVSGYLRERIS